MDARKLTKLRDDLTAFLDAVAGPLGHPRRRKWCDAYLRGLLLDGRRKTAEPRAARPRAVARGAEDYGRPLPQFLNQSPWDEQATLDGLPAWVGRRFGTAGCLITGDTGLPEPGEHSVGVARQYTGTLGKVASCQVAVTPPFATATRVIALDARLYLPEGWASDRGRMARAGVPDGAGYRPKWEIALGMEGLPVGDLEGGVEGEDDRPVRGPAGPAGAPAVGRRGAALAALAVGRVAGLGRATGQVLLQQPAGGGELEAAGGHGREPVVGGAQLPRAEGRARAGPLRGAVVAGVEPPRRAGAAGRRLPPGRPPAPPPNSGGPRTLPRRREELQAVLACWCARGPVCGRTVPELLKTKPP